MVEITKNKSESTKRIENNYDCDEASEEFQNIINVIAPIVDRNPRRMKQFSNSFRFHKTIGNKVGLFYYDKGTDPKYMWNCKKLAKFVAITIKWPHIISALSLNVTLLEQLQNYALKDTKKPKESTNSALSSNITFLEQLQNCTLKETKKLEEDKRFEADKKLKENDILAENEKLENWINDKKLMMLLKFGCMTGDEVSTDIAEYTLSGLDFGKLLNISPEILSPYSLSEIIENIDFVQIPSGEFEMGSQEDEADRYDNEGPVRKVTINRPFEIGKYPVTQKQWIAIMGFNPSQFKGEKRPVENITWNEVQKFISKLNDFMKTDKYRLPSEAEWEYACRATTKMRFFFGDDVAKLVDYAWYSGNSIDETHLIGKRNPNQWGLFDMYGNVWEWCQDKWHDTYDGAPSNEEAWESGSSSNRVRRGGACNRNVRSCRSASREGYDSDVRSIYLGFRLVKDL